MSLAILDIEMILHRAIHAAQFEYEWSADVWMIGTKLSQAKVAVIEEIHAVRAVAPDHQLAVALGDSKGFRDMIWPGYKAKRKDLKKPSGFGALLDWLKDVAELHSFRVLQLPLVEADDTIGIYAGPGDLILSGDKDMRTVPGLHLIDGEITEITRSEADYTFFKQVLTGDTTDGYPGCPGLGEVGATKALNKAEDLGDAAQWAAVVEAYKKAGRTEQDAVIQARCARILRHGEYDWDRRMPLLWRPPLPCRAATTD